MIDDRQGLYTPEGAELSLVLAGPVVRTAAFTLDLLIRIAIYILVAIISAFIGGIGNGVILISMFLLEWFYPVLFEVFRDGQTPGKKSMGIAVTHSDGTPITINGSLIRNLLRNADMFPGCYLAGFIAMLCNQRFQRLGDLAADTVVVYVNKPELTPVEVNVVAETPDWTVSLADQRTLVSFLERGVKLSQARRQELAVLAYQEASPERAEVLALAHARHLLGGRTNNAANDEKKVAQNATQPIDPLRSQEGNA